jgi:SAM-dependent methyltransferase
MKVREGGMPAEEMWKSFFDPELILKELSLGSDCKTVVDFGCGYGTFTIPAAQMTKGVVYGFDIEAELVEACKSKASEAALTNLNCQQRDFIVDGTGLPDETADYVMLFNILHTEKPLALLQEAYRILNPLGKIGVIHWNYDPTTPRGPSMDIRPRPEQCQAWMQATGFELLTNFIDLPPYHYGITGRKRALP